MTQLPPATDDVAVLVELLGPETALRLLEAAGGTRVYVARPGAGNALAEIIGLDGASAIHTRYGHGWFKVPMGRAWRVLCYIAMGLSRPKAALRAGCSENMVHDVLTRYGRPASQQLDLFG